MKSYLVDFEPVGRRGKCSVKQSLLECAQHLGLGLVSICGGRGLCKECKIQIINGTVSEPTAIEQSNLSHNELQEGYRLACQTYPTSDCKVRLPAESMSTSQRMQVDGLELPNTVSSDMPITNYHLALPPPSSLDLRGDTERVLETLNQQYRVPCSAIDFVVLSDLSSQLRSWQWQVQASVRDEEIVAFSPWHGRTLGLAIDLGTTKIAGYLLDLGDGRTLAAEGIMNPQISYGEDIITRLSRIIDSPKEGQRMRKLVVQTLNQLASDLCIKAKAKREEVVEVVVVGNTAMHHLLLGLPVEQLAYSPFVPSVCQALDIKSRDIGLNIAPGAYVYLLPNIAGFVGADHTAMLLATKAWHIDGLSVILDIGTNTEVCLSYGGEMASVSCASGPAFEGGHIKDGMRAASGAIEKLRLVNNETIYQTINAARPVGLCGSGMLDTLAQLYLHGIIDEKGRMGKDHPRVRTREGQNEFVVVSEEERNGLPAITFTQQDVRELQLAKGAIRCGIEVLLENKGYNYEEIDQVIIAGAFGYYIDIYSAVTIGIFPPLPLNRFRQVGNAAGVGAKLALISRSKRAEANSIARSVEYIELASAPHFTQIFAQANYIGQYKIAHDKREKVG